MAKALLYDYFRSSASYRVRIALNLKGIDYEQRSISLVQGDQKAASYRALNPQGFVPMLEIDGHRLTQSLSIIAYLDQTRPDPPLMPADPAEAAHVRSLALAVACDIHPLNNLRVLKYLQGTFGIDDAAKDLWYRHWIEEGLAALEEMAKPHAGAFLFGDSPTIADICLVPQLYNARRFSVPVADYPTLRRADETASAHPAFGKAHPDRQEH
ncbi:MAG TPA: maleylacetoacetate isomerase [Sphingomicrobium sp.]|nr:maleylacetoacetate isomerase [Sphingomicrobium sp.]